MSNCPRWISEYSGVLVDVVVSVDDNTCTLGCVVVVVVPVVVLEAGRVIPDDDPCFRSHGSAMGGRAVEADDDGGARVVCWAVGLACGCCCCCGLADGGCGGGGEEEEEEEEEAEPEAFC